MLYFLTFRVIKKNIKFKKLYFSETFYSEYWH